MSVLKKGNISFVSSNAGIYMFLKEWRLLWKMIMLVVDEKNVYSKN